MSPDRQRPKGLNFLAKYAPVTLAPVAVVGGALLSSCRGETQPTVDQHVLIEPIEPNREFLEVDGYKFTLNSHGIPQGYTDPKGEYTRFNIAQLAELRNTATRDRLPEVVGLIKVEDQSTNAEVFFDELVRPVFKELPEDVLSKEELAQRGVRVIQAENSQLNIRTGAFEEGGSLDHLSKKERKLIIALVDGNQISRDLMKDSRYDEVRDTLPETDPNTKAYKEKRLEELRIEVNESILGAQEAKNAQELDAAVHLVLKHKTYLEAYESGFITKEQLEHEEAERNAFYSGKYFPPETSGIDNTEVIFVSVGRKDSKTDSLRMYFDGTGKFVVDKFVVAPPVDIGGGEKVCVDDGHSVVCIKNSTELPDYSPNASQGFPTVEMLKKRNDGVYKFEHQTPGQTITHEIGHSKNDPDPSEKKADEYVEEKFRSGRYDLFFSIPDDNANILTGDESLINSNTETS